MATGTYGRGGMLGANIDPRMFLQDFSGFARAGEIQAQGITNLAQGVTQGIEGYQEAKKIESEENRAIQNARQLGEAVLKVDPSMADIIGNSLNLMASPDANRNDKLGAAEGIRELLQTTSDIKRNQEMMALKRASMAGSGSGGASSPLDGAMVLTPEELQKKRAEGISGKILGSTEDGNLIVSALSFSKETGSSSTTNADGTPIKMTDDEISNLISQGFRVSSRSKNDDGTSNVTWTSPIGRNPMEQRVEQFQKMKELVLSGDIGEAVFLANAANLAGGFQGLPATRREVLQTLGLTEADIGSAPSQPQESTAPPRLRFNPDTNTAE